MWFWGGVLVGAVGSWVGIRVGGAGGVVVDGLVDGWGLGVVWLEWVGVG